MDLILTSSCECHCLPGNIIPAFVDQRINELTVIVSLPSCLSFDLMLPLCELCKMHVAQFDRIVRCMTVAKSLPYHSWLASGGTCLLAKICQKPLMGNYLTCVNVESSKYESV